MTEKSASRVGPQFEHTVKELIAAAAADLISGRPHAKLTRTELAKKAGLSLSVVSHFLDGGTLDGPIARSLISSNQSDIEALLGRPLGGDQKAEQLVKLLLTINKTAGALMS